MSMSVNQLAAQTGLTVDQVLEACRRAGVSAWGPTTILLDGDLQAIHPHLGAAPPAPAPPPGQPCRRRARPTARPRPPPGQPLPPPGQAYGAPPPPGSLPPPGQSFGRCPRPGSPTAPCRRLGSPSERCRRRATPCRASPRRRRARAPDRPHRRRHRRARPRRAHRPRRPRRRPRGGRRRRCSTGCPTSSGPSSPTSRSATASTTTATCPISTGTSLIEAAVEQVPCSGTHDAEVYFVFDHPAPPDSPYPGDGPIFDTSIARCMEQFEGFVGAPYETSALDVYFLAPVPGGLQPARRPQDRVRGGEPRHHAAGRRHPARQRPLTDPYGGISRRLRPRPPARPSAGR